ncbi:flagellar basal body P-ring protein FlgI [Buchnera aphidicola (Ceratovacuna keduensis)]|uniref:flagellar basal body P-ring protein FlgI n=1 Tax=Buchnera aphidicola TaxID=9 RepID=UPI0031B82CE2
MKKILIFSKILISLLFLFNSTFSFAEKIKDLTNINGIRDNQLIGYGLVVGLDGTGDSISQAPFTLYALKNILYKLGTTIKKNNNMQLKNIASVMVTTELPLFSEIGEKIDVRVSSIGNCKSLEGGTLILTPLKGIDNKIYAIAQGKVIIDKKDEKKNKNFNLNLNTPKNSGKILNGGNIEKIVENNFYNKKVINLQLKYENFILAKKISDEINKYYPNTAMPINSKKITILNDKKTNYNIVEIISNIQNINVKVPTEPKIFINKNNGLIITNSKIKVEPCNINYKNLYINLQENIKKTTKQIKENQIIINSGVLLEDILPMLKTFKIETNEIIEILKILKSSKCLSAKIEILK